MVYRDDQPVLIKRRLLRAILFYLAYQQEMVGRLDLISLFWPELPEEKSRLHLRDSLSKLRSELPDPSILKVDQDNIGLDQSRLYVDVLEFSRLVNQTRRPLSQIARTVPMSELTYQQVERAANLWRSAQFLAGARLPANEGFDRWVLEKSQDLKNTRLYLLERLADHAAAIGDLEAGLRWIRSALEVDELNTNLNYRLLSWLNDLGRRGEALNHFKRLESIVKKERGGELLPAIIALQKKIRSQVDFPEPTDRSFWPSPTATNLPMVGQKKALREMQLAFQRGGAVAVLGEAGSGKTRLVYQLFQSLQPAPRLLIAPARSMESNLPFQPLIELMRHSILPFEWSKLDAVWITQLARLVPELSILRTDLSQSLQIDTGDNRSILYESLHHLFLKLSGDRRILFLLEDAHWADQATFQLLTYLLERNFFIKHGLLVISARVEIHNPFLDEFLTHPNPYSPPFRIDLEPLGVEEVSNLSDYVLDYTPPQSVLQYLTRDSGGNPLLLLETLRALFEIFPGPDLLLNIDHFPIPGSVHAIIRERLRLLDQSTRQVLTTAAIIGNEFTPQLLEYSTLLGPDEVARVFEELENSHLVRPVQPGARDSTYAFIHNRVREVLLMELSPARKRVLHLRIAHALETRAGASTHLAGVLAGHYEEAGELQSALNYWLLAGEYARQLSSRSETDSAYRHAEKIVQQPDLFLPEQAIYQLYSNWGEAAADQDDTKTMLLVYTAMQKIGEQRHSSLLIGSGLSGQVLLDIVENQLKDALEKIEQAIFYLEQSGDLYEQMQANNRQAIVLLMVRNNLEALRGFQKTIEIGKKSANPHVQQAVIDAERQMALTYHILGWPLKAVEAVQQSLRASQRSFYSSGILRAYPILGMSLLSAGWYESVLENCRVGLQIAEKIHNPAIQARLDLLMSRAALALGRLDDSFIYLDNARLIAQENHIPETRSACHSVLGHIYKELQDYPRAIASFQNSLVGKQLQNQALGDQCFLSEALFLNGQEAAGIDILGRLTQIVKESETGILSLPAELGLARFYYSSGNYKEARRIADSVAIDAVLRSMPSVAINAELLLSSIAIQQEDLPEALAGAHKAIERSREIANPWLELKGLLLLKDLSRRGCQLEWDPQERLRELLHIIQINVTKPEILPVLKKFVQNSLGKTG